MSLNVSVREPACRILPTELPPAALSVNAAKSKQNLTRLRSATMKTFKSVVGFGAFFNKYKEIIFLVDKSTCGGQQYSRD